MNWLRRLGWKLIRFFLFRVDAEDAHRFMVRMIRASIAFNNIPIKITAGSASKLETECDVLGLRFRSRVGLAAGFDKDAEILAALPHLGFGFAEIGTVTPRPQPGNDRPRLFRDPARESLFNRMGFNGLGATLVSERWLKSGPLFLKTSVSA
jgi:dihydroorotate dehydrogenase